MAKYQHHWINGKAIDLPTGKAVCVGKNYADHIREMNEVMATIATTSSYASPDQTLSTPSTKPVLFIKPSSAVCDANSNIQISHLEELGELHHELEIAVLIGEPLNRDSDNHLEAIIGIGLAIDLTLRDLQADLKKRGLPWERAKSFDASCPTSKFLPFSIHDEPSKNPLSLENNRFELRVNKSVKQQGNSSSMLCSITDLLVEISQSFSLQAGDIVLTGTPAGVGPLLAGDVISASLNEHQLIDQTLIV